MSNARSFPALCNYAMFCAGCGHGVLLRLICECLEETGQGQNTIAAIGETLRNVGEAAEKVASGSSQVSSSSQSLAQGSTQQAASVEKISVSMTQLAAQTKINAENASQASQLAVAWHAAGPPEYLAGELVQRSYG